MHLSSTCHCLPHLSFHEAMTSFEIGVSSSTTSPTSPVSLPLPSVPHHTSSCSHQVWSWSLGTSWSWSPFVLATPHSLPSIRYRMYTFIHTFPVLLPSLFSIGHFLVRWLVTSIRALLLAWLLCRRQYLWCCCLKSLSTALSQFASSIWPWLSHWAKPWTSSSPLQQLPSSQVDSADRLFSNLDPISSVWLSVTLYLTDHLDCPVKLWVSYSRSQVPLFSSKVHCWTSLHHISLPLIWFPATLSVHSCPMTAHLAS